MVDDNDNIKLIDFGIAGDAAARRLTYANFTATLGTRRLHLARAGEGQAGRRPLRHLCRGRHPLRDAHGQAALLRLVAHGSHERPDAEPSAAAALWPTRRSRRNCRRSCIARWSAIRRIGMRRAQEFAHDLQHLDEVGVEDRVEFRDWKKRKSHTIAPDPLLHRARPDSSCYSVIDGACCTAPVGNLHAAIFTDSLYREP